MNSKRSMWKVLLGVVGMGLLVTNCTIKTDDSDDSCTPGKKKNCSACDDGVIGYQTCQDDGTYDSCYCPGSVVGGGSNGGGSNAGASNSTAGKGGAATNGGASSAGEGGAGGALSEAGAGGETAVLPPVDPNDCYDCLNKLCTQEWDACVLEDELNPETAGNYCLSSKLDGSGQIEAVIDCIETERKKGSVKRDIVRACGSSLGQSTDPSFFLWPPTDMTAATAGVINCMADAPTELNPGTWANSNNIPTSGAPKPWLDMTCAKLSCTSAQ
jgi:hypothetical protein